MTRQVSLGEVAEINPPAPLRVRQNPEAEASFVTMAGVSESGRIVSEATRTVAEVLKGYSYFERGDVLLAKITPCMENGKAALAYPLRHPIGFGSTEFHVLRSGPDVDPRYLLHLVRTPAFRTVAARNMTGSAGQKRVPTDFVRRYKFYLPPLPEQRRIAAILDKADANSRRTRERCSVADELLRSQFLELFGDPATNPRSWPVYGLGDVAAITTGNTPPRPRPELYGNAIEWIKSDNINTSEHVLTRAAEGLSDKGMRLGRIVEAGATLMTCIAGSPACIGNVALANRRVAFNQQINAISAGTQVDPWFLYVQLLLAKVLIQAASTASMKGMVSKGRLSAVRLPVPPLEEQRKFGKWFRRFLSWRSLVASHATESERLADVSSHSLLSGGGI